MFGQAHDYSPSKVKKMKRLTPLNFLVTINLAVDVVALSSSTLHASVVPNQP